MTDSLDTCARELLDVMPMVMQHLRQTMRGQSLPDLRVPELRCLTFLRQKPGSNLTDVAEYVGVSLPSMSKIVDAMTDRGLISRIPDSRDRRRVQLSLTDPGHAELDMARETAMTAFRDKLTLLTAGDMESLARSLQLLRRLFGPARDDVAASDTDSGVY